MKLLLTAAAIAGVFYLNHRTIMADEIERWSGPEAAITRQAVRKMVYAIILEIVLIIGVAVT